MWANYITVGGIAGSQADIGTLKGNISQPKPCLKANGCAFGIGPYSFSLCSTKGQYLSKSKSGLLSKSWQE